MSNRPGARWISAVVLGAVLATGTSAAAATRCDQLLVRLAQQVTDANCFESTDLTTNNLATTPADNSLTPPLPAFAFTPQTDRAPSSRPARRTARQSPRQYRASSSMRALPTIRPARAGS